MDGAGDRAAQLKIELSEAKKAIESTRDELDSGAQEYVKQLAKIKELNNDVQKNINEIREVGCINFVPLVTINLC